MRAPERLSIPARLRISILVLVTTLVGAGSAMHLHEVIGETLNDMGERARIVAEQTATFLIYQRDWRTNPGLQRFLQKSMVRTSSIVDVSVVDDSGVVLASADPRLVGNPAPDGRPWDAWQHQGVTSRLLDLYNSRSDLLIETPLQGMAVRVALSPVLILEDLRPKLRNLLVMSVLSILLSAVLAMLVSKLVGDSLDRLGQKIDLIAQGDLVSIQHDRFDSPELINLESKLWWLGRQYTGARADVVQLRSSVEQMLRKLEEAVLVFGPDGRLQLAGEAAQRILARSKDELAGKSLGDIFPGWTSAGAAVDSALAAQTSVRDLAITVDRPNLPSVRLLVSIEPMRHDDGSPAGLLVSMRDAETRQQLQADLDTARRLAAISRISSGVAHEIKNPLNAMMLHLSIAEDKVQRGKDCSPELGIVQQELLRLDRVVKALLDFNRPVDVRMQACDLSEIASNIAALLRPQAQALGVSLTVESRVDHAPITADPDLLTQAVLNVAINGLDVTPRGGVLRIHVERQAAEYVIAVEDSGPGIPAEIRDKIFNLYFTTKETGTGVGLAMTYRIIQLHGGNITLESEVGRGSCFRLALPVRQPLTVAA